VSARALPPALRRSLPLLAIAALALGAYASSFDGDFVFDSVGGVRDSARVRSVAALLDPAQLLGDNRWFGYLTFAVNRAVHGTDVAGYHVVNFLVHLASALVVHALVVVTFATPRLRASAVAPWSREIAFVAAALFVAHPLQTQAVSYIVQRFTSLAALLYLLSLLLYARWRVWREEGGRSPSRDAVAWAGILVTAVLAMKTKEIAFTLPFAAAAFEAVFFEGRASQRALRLAPLLATLPIIPLGRLAAAGPLDLVAAPLDAAAAVSDATRVQTALSRSDYLATQLPVLASYLRLVVAPVGQNVDPDVAIQHSFLSPPVVASGLLLLALVALAAGLLWRTGRPAQPLDAGWRLVAFGIVWFFLTIAVESSVIPLVDPMFEHRLYLPLAGLFAGGATAAALLLRARPAGRRAFVAGGVLVSVALAVATFARNRVWADELALWSDAVQKSPAKARPHQNLGVALAAAGRLPEAVEAFARANRADPANAEVMANMGVALRDLGKRDEAEGWLRAAMRARPDLADAHYNLGCLLMDAPGSAAEALSLFDRAIELRPGWAPAYANLAATLNRMGRFDEAIARLERAGPALAESADARFNLGVAYAMASNDAGAWREVEALSRLAPDRARQLASFVAERGAAR
jgi:tetratricopeptide (TPR) repeat protein